MRVTTTQEASDLESTLSESQISNQQEKEGGNITMVNTILKLKGIYSFCHVVLILSLHWAF